MKTLFTLLFILTLFSCNGTTEQSPVPIEGTWKLISATLVENGQQTIIDYTRDVSFIKILNRTHFAFLQHDLKKGKDSVSVFVAGGGKYSLVNDNYTEHLEYCSARDWEGNNFSFTIVIKGDTLTQTGVEKVESLGVNRLNIEKYVRINE